MPNCLIISDAWNHNSMIEGVRQAHTEKQIFRHNDMAHLEQLLVAADPVRPWRGAGVAWPTVRTADVQTLRRRKVRA